MTSQKTGASALGVQRVLGWGSYQTAWAWLHTLRRAMVRPGRDRLAGRVEVDETSLGGLEEGVRGRQTRTNALIVVAAQEGGAGIGRIRMRRALIAGEQDPDRLAALAKGSLQRKGEALVPAFLLALLAGLFLIHAAGVTFHEAWFSVKIALLLGVILVDLLASRQFKAFNASGQVGRPQDSWRSSLCSPC